MDSAPSNAGITRGPIYKFRSDVDHLNRNVPPITRIGTVVTIVAKNENLPVRNDDRAEVAGSRVTLVSIIIHQ